MQACIGEGSSLERMGYIITLTLKNSSTYLSKNGMSWHGICEMGGSRKRISFTVLDLLTGFGMFGVIKKGLSFS